MTDGFVDPASAEWRHQARMGRLRQAVAPVQPAPVQPHMGMGSMVTSGLGAAGGAALAMKLIPHPAAQAAGWALPLAASLVGNIGGALAGHAVGESTGLNKAIDEHPGIATAALAAPVALLALRRGKVPAAANHNVNLKGWTGLNGGGGGAVAPVNPPAGPSNVLIRSAQVIHPEPMPAGFGATPVHAEVVPAQSRALNGGVRGFLEGPRAVVPEMIPTAHMGVPLKSLHPDLAVMPHVATDIRTQHLGGPVKLLREGPVAMPNMVAPSVMPVDVHPMRIPTPTVTGMPRSMVPVLKKKIAEVSVPALKVRDIDPRSVPRYREIQSAIVQHGPENVVAEFNKTARASGQHPLTETELQYIPEVTRKLQQSPIEHQRARLASEKLAPEEEMLTPVPERFTGVRQELLEKLGNHLERQLRAEQDPKKRIALVRQKLIGESKDVKAAVREHLKQIAPDVHEHLEAKAARVKPVAEVPVAEVPPVAESPQEQQIRPFMEQDGAVLYKRNNGDRLVATVHKNGVDRVVIKKNGETESLGSGPIDGKVWSLANPEQPLPHSLLEPVNLSYHQQSTVSPADAVAKVRAALESGDIARQGSLQSFRDLREATGLPKDVFDDAVHEIAKSGEVSMHRHDYASSLTPAERDVLVPTRNPSDSKNENHYVGMALRRPEPEAPVIKEQANAIGSERQQGVSFPEHPHGNGGGEVTAPVSRDSLVREGSRVGQAEAANPAVEPTQVAVQSPYAQHDEALKQWAVHHQDVVEPLRKKLRDIESDANMMAMHAKQTEPGTPAKSKLTKKAFFEKYGVANKDEAKSLYKQKLADAESLREQLSREEKTLQDLESRKNATFQAMQSSANPPWHGNRETVFAAMRNLDDKIQHEWQQARETSPRGGSIGVGSADFDHALKATVGEEYLRTIRKGGTPDEALQAAIAAGRDTVKNWNEKTSKGRASFGGSHSLKRWDQAGDDIAESFHRQFVNAAEPTPAQPVAAPKPTSEPAPKVEKLSAKKPKKPAKIEALTPKSDSKIVNPYGDTPAGKAYVSAKTEHPDSLVLLKRGHSYELFGSDAETAAKALGLSVSHLDKNSKNPIAMTGFSHQQLEANLKKLVAAGHRVSIAAE